MHKLAEKYRMKALIAEQSAKVAPDKETKMQWSDIAIEWHALAARTSTEVTQDVEMR